jgi:hypothetical protein
MAQAWPQPLKYARLLFLSSQLTLAASVLVHRDWVAKCMGQMTDFNREEAQNELKAIIGDAHLNQRLWTTDWAGMQLQRCDFIYI